ncbi:hypothetical protein CPB84DRAFT_1743319 [Gymnopilus junonius]|uniref:Uncharacterized protein n=1 Tax=Gymnopilus junonius TaxID=109634 RepID=A0A9P5NXS8_GYMJU|nr:hypothetical protein CPB84DRAFT_1743319 [Gymnopilus junonius]
MTHLQMLFPMCCLSVIMVTVLTWKHAFAVPVMDAASIGLSGVGGDFEPLLHTLQPVAVGAEQGLENGTGDLKATVKDTGSALDHLINASGDILSNVEAVRDAVIIGIIIEGSGAAGVTRTTADQSSNLCQL